MNQSFLQLEPNNLWCHFLKLNSIPRASKKEQIAIEYLIEFAKRLNLEYIQDKIGNLIIYKNSSNGHAYTPTIILQSHVDMVHQKIQGINFDFDTQGIDVMIDGDWVKAKGTTLGADNGIGVATILAILESTEIIHPNIEALFTIDEEAGMTGAKELATSLLKGTILLNLDTEFDDEIIIGSAGSQKLDIIKSFHSSISENNLSIQLNIEGLIGGHSGLEINNARLNAIKELFSLLFNISKEIDIELYTLTGGNLVNAIPRNSSAIIFINPQEYERVSDIIDIYCKSIIHSSSFSDTQFRVKITKVECAPNTKAVDKVNTKLFLAIMNQLPNGVCKLNLNNNEEVQTSINMGIVSLKNGKFELNCLIRSSVLEDIKKLVKEIDNLTLSISCQTKTSPPSPSWHPDYNQPIITTIRSIYNKLFDKEIKVKTVHAGLECSYFIEKLPCLQMVSIGPTIIGAHSPDEKVSISSVEKFWSLVVEILEEVK